MANCGDLQYASGDVCIGGNLVVAGTVTAAGGVGSGITAVNGTSPINAVTTNGVVALTYTGSSSGAVVTTIFDSYGPQGYYTASPTLGSTGATPNTYLVFASSISTNTVPPLVYVPLEADTPYFITGSISVRTIFGVVPTSIDFSPTIDFYMASIAQDVVTTIAPGISPCPLVRQRWAHVKYANASEVFNSISGTTCELTFPISCVLTTPSQQAAPLPLLDFQLSLGVSISGAVPAQPTPVTFTTVQMFASSTYLDTNLSYVKLSFPTPPP